MSQKVKEPCEQHRVSSTVQEIIESQLLGYPIVCVYCGYRVQLKLVEVAK